MESKTIPQIELLKVSGNLSQLSGMDQSVRLTSSHSLAITDSLEQSSSNDYDVNNPMFTYEAPAAGGSVQNAPKIRGKMWVLYINDKAQNW